MPALKSILLTLLLANTIGLLLSFTWVTGLGGLLLRTSMLGLAALAVFNLLQYWPKRLPKWLSRWVLQVLATALVIPLACVVIYTLSTAPGAAPFWQEPERMAGFMTLTVVGVLIAPWGALTALVRQKDALARHQALAFDLERSELERQALAARHKLLQAQVSPHFLFNTLANIQALVDANSPSAAPVLRSLVAYLRAAVPKLNEQASTVEQECQLIKAYLQLMHMRMPDRLEFSLSIDESAKHLRCPPMTLMTLVENAVRHGIDPSEQGGRIDIRVQHCNERCQIRVRDSGIGLTQSVGGTGTGLAAMRERLQQHFQGDVQLRLTTGEPHGVCAEVEFPAQSLATD